MLNFYSKKLWMHSTIFIGFILFSSIIRAQCAGTSNMVTVCEKQLDPSTQTFNLFSQLGGNPVPEVLGLATIHLIIPRLTKTQES